MGPVISILKGDDISFCPSKADILGEIGATVTLEKKEPDSRIGFT
jgi:hypothetical protein